MYQKRLRDILIELEDIQEQIMNGLTVDPALLEGIKIENDSKLEAVTDEFIGKAYSAIARLIYKLDGE